MISSTDSQALLYGTSTTFMAYACVPEVSDNVASSILFQEKGAEFHGLCRQAVKQCLVAAGVVLSVLVVVQYKARETDDC
jgi:hypothetical protein